MYAAGKMHMWKKGDTCNMEHWPHHLPHIQNLVQSGQTIATPRWQDLVQFSLYITYRLQTISHSATCTGGLHNSPRRKFKGIFVTLH